VAKALVLLLGGGKGKGLNVVGFVHPFWGEKGGFGWEGVHHTPRHSLAVGKRERRHELSKKKNKKWKRECESFL